MELEIKGLNKLINLAEKYPKVSEKHINRAIARALTRIWGKEKQEAPVDTGNLRDNWQLNVSRFSGFLRSNAPYALGIEFGTRPHWVSIDKIAPWAKKRGLNPWAVRNSIAKKGTKANPFFQRSIKDASEGVNKEFKTAIDDTLKELTK